MRKMIGITVISKFILRLPVMAIGIILGVVVAFIRSVWVATREISDTLMDMVWNIEYIDELNQRNKEDFFDSPYCPDHSDADG